MNSDRVNRSQGTADLLAVGEAMIVLVPDPIGPLRAAASFASSVTGAESTVARYAARLGMRSAWSGGVGDDPFGARILAELAADGIDVSRVRVSTAPTGVFFKDPGPTGTRVRYYRKGSAGSELNRRWWESLAELRPRVTHLTGITAALSEGALDFLRFGLETRPIPNTVYSFDVNYRPGLWSTSEAAPVLRALADNADIVSVGLDEARALWRVDEPIEVRELLHGPETVVVRDAANGAYVFAGREQAFAPALSVDVVEPVGAGDAFVAGFLWARDSGLGLAEQLAAGHIVAAVALQSSADVAPFDAQTLELLRGLAGKVRQ
ncbi:sugar kinase [Leifsonia sp. NPDC077715]|uniref:sugar kinase n=1 Tax=Leifsonia sp. NPDC077715 TaxID=3155539 RepID=UPI003418B29F